MNILLPIETINREIDFKLMLGAMLSGEGYKIFIGQHDFLLSLLPRLKTGVYIGKNIFHKKSNEEDGKRYYQLKEQNFDIIYLHEEGGVFVGDERRWKQILCTQYDPSLFDDKDRLCVWGNFQKEFDQTRIKDVPVYAVGHPRFDLYKIPFKAFYQEEVQKILNRYGSYVLINGNYSWANHGKGLHHTFAESNREQEVGERLRRVHYYSYFTRQMVAMVELTHRLAVKFPEINFIYRPHPSENHHYYEVVFKGIANILVNRKGSVNAWILGAKALIHDGCTTAIEATIAGIPAINYKPFFDLECDIWLANSMGAKAATEEEVISFLLNLGAFQKKDLEKISPLAHSLLFNFQGDSFSALTSVIAEKIIEKKIESTEFPSRQFIQIKYAQIQAKLAGQLLLQPQKAKTILYHQTKFYGFDPEMIHSKLANAALLLGKKIRWTYYNKNLIRIDS